MKEYVSIRYTFIGLMVALAILLCPAALGTEVIAVVSGDVQGVIEGGYDIDPALNSILVTEYHHLMLRSEVTTAPEHKEAIFTKPVDEATVNLWRAFDTDEALTVRFEHWVECTSGAWGWTHKVEFTGATIRAIEPIFLPGDDIVSERVRLRYLQMTVDRQRLNFGDCSTSDPSNITVSGNFPP